MRKAAGKKLPIFSFKQSKQVMNSFDFFGVNYYLTSIVGDKPNYVSADQRDFAGDSGVTFGDYSTEGGPFNVPDGLQGVLEYFKQNYGNPPIYIHENGYPMPSNATLDDTERVNHMREHFGSVRDAIKNGSNAKGFFTWSFLDVFELLDGYSSTFGLYHVDFEDQEKDIQSSQPNGIPTSSRKERMISTVATPPRTHTFHRQCAIKIRMANNVGKKLYERSK